jgi:hypothetical protein
MRRAMRKGENNPYAVLIVGPDEPFAFIALAAIGKWAFRHRSAFAPFIITLAVFVAAAMTHGHHARWWIPVAAVTATTTLLVGFPHAVLRRHQAGRRIARILAWLWQRCGIDRAIERAYAGTVIAVTGGWLAAAIAVGPAVRPLPVIAGTGSVVLSIPWWFHLRRSRQPGQVCGGEVAEPGFHHSQRVRHRGGGCTWCGRRVRRGAHRRCGGGGRIRVGGDGEACGGPCASGAGGRVSGVLAGPAARAGLAGVFGVGCHRAVTSSARTCGLNAASVVPRGPRCGR